MKSPRPDELGPGVLAQLLDAARAKVTAVRRAVYEQLYEQSRKGGRHVTLAIPVLIAGLGDRDPGIAGKATYGLSYCAPASLPPLLRCLSHDDALVRERAAHALGLVGPSARGAAADALRGRLDDAAEPVRRRAAWAMGLLRATDARTVAALAAQATRGGPSERSAALHALGNLARAQEAPASLVPHRAMILDALSDADPDVRWSALYAGDMTGLEPQAWADAMAGLLTKEDAPRVRFMLLGRLAEMAPGVDLVPHLPVILRFVGSSTQDGPAALKLLAAMQPPPRAAVPTLLALLEVDRFPLDAARTLWRLGHPVEPLLAALQRRHPGFDESVCDFICELGPAAAPLAPELIAALAEQDWDTSWAAADAPGAIASADAAVTATLRTAQDHPSAIVRAAAAHALGRLGPASVPRATGTRSPG